MQLATNRPSLPRRHRGALVLILVLIVVLMVSLAGFTFAELMLTENKATRLQGEQVQLQQVLRSGEEYLKLFLEQPQAMQIAAGGVWNNESMFRAIGLRPEVLGERTVPNQAYFSIISPLQSETPQQTTEPVRYGVENESGRLHLADLLRYEETDPAAGRLALMRLPGMTEDVADSILDWIDADSDPRPQGAESEYYDTLPQPYAVRNGLPECLDELLLVKGVTRQLLFGADNNYNRQLEPAELALQADAPRGTTSDDAVPWSWLLTVYSAERNVNAAGQPRIHLNDPDLLRMHHQLTTAFGPELASFVVAYRQFGPTLAAGAAQPGVVPVDLTLPPQFEILSPLDLVNAQVTLSGGKTADAQAYASPFSGDPQSMAKQLATLLDLTTASDLPVVRGLVSVNDAPAPVLSAVPGIDESLTQSILAARKSAEGTDSDRHHAVWLLTEGLVDLETMKKLMPFVTGGGHVVRAQIVAHTDKPAPTARAEVILDATTAPARQLLWRDLRFHGLGFPRELFEHQTTAAASN